MRLFGKKMLISCLALGLGMAWATGASAAENPFILKKPPFKSIIVDYKMTGSTNGTSRLYLKGDTRAKHTDAVTKVFGMTNKDKKIDITKPKTVIHVDLVKKEATETGNPMYYMAREYEKLSPSEQKTVRKNAEHMGANLAAGFTQGGKPEVKKGKYMGKPVDIVTVMGFTSYSWTKAAIPLKIEGSMMGVSINEAATDIKTNVSLPSDAFEVPGGITVRFDKQADQKMREMARNWIEMLKDPEFGKNGQTGGAGGLSAIFNSAGQDQSADPDPEADSSSEQNADNTDETLKQGMKMLKGLFD
jgi:hypothetical protein